MDEIIPFMTTAVVIDGLIISACIVECFLLLKTKRNRSNRKFEPMEILLFSLCISDFLSGSSMLIGDSCSWYNEVTRGNPFGSTVGLVSDGLIAFFVFLSNFHVMSIATERVIAVAFPTKYNRFDNTRYKCIAVSVIWVLAIILVAGVFGLFFDFKTKRDEGTTKVFGYFWVCSCGMVFITYTILFVLLMLRERKLRQLLGEDLRKHARSRRNTYICLLLGCSFVICVLPFSLSAVDDKLFSPIFPTLLTLNHVFNPCVYFIKYHVEQRRRRAASNLSTSMKERTSSQTPTTITSMSTSSSTNNVS